MGQNGYYNGSLDGRKKGHEHRDFSLKREVRLLKRYERKQRLWRAVGMFSKF